MAIFIDIGTFCQWANVVVLPFREPEAGVIFNKLYKFNSIFLSSRWGIEAEFSMCCDEVPTVIAMQCVQVFKRNAMRIQGSGVSLYAPSRWQK